ncbi:MAG: hypothetical protein AMJ90_08515 [candidate division Zixibacteria bacterium SM23_73_2]|nr:MAG: hypothetical protein AMJ90_08515 [candidate division Zixibacteria bacterium SM23_73_2]
MRRDFTISLLLHLSLVVALFFLPGSARQMEYPTVYRVGLVSMPKKASARSTGEEGGVSEVKTSPKKPEEGVALKQVEKKEEKKTEKKSITKKTEEKKENGKDKKDEASKKEGNGNGEGKEGEGSKEGVGTAEFEGAYGGVDFGGSYYVDVMKSKIGEFWRNPLRRATSVIRVTIYFKIEKGGKLKDAIIEKSSGNELFDNAALRSVLSSDPLPPLPQEYTGEVLGVHLEFEYTP